MGVWWGGSTHGEPRLFAPTGLIKRRQFASLCQRDSVEGVECAGPRYSSLGGNNLSDATQHNKTVMIGGKQRMAYKKLLIKEIMTLY